MMYDECDMILARIQLHGDFESEKSNQKCLLCAHNNYQWFEEERNTLQRA